MRTVKTCAGIGDAIWVLGKLAPLKQKFNFILAGDEPHRGKQIFDLLPTIANGCEYGDFGSMEAIKGSIHLQHGYYGSIQGATPFFLAINQHLEQGKRIEDFMPDLKMQFSLPYKTKKFKGQAKKLMGKKKKKYIGIYAARYEVLGNWNFWKEDGWLDLIKRIYILDKNVEFVVIGADYDLDLGSTIINGMKELNIPCIELIGEELGLVIEALKRLDYLFAFPSGIPIISTSLEIPTLMFYPPHLEPMIDTWANPKLIKNSTYKGMLFCTVDEAFGWVKNKYKLFDRL